MATNETAVNAENAARVAKANAEEAAAALRQSSISDQSYKLNMQGGREMRFRKGTSNVKPTKKNNYRMGMLKPLSSRP